MNLILCGFMGCGKTTVGLALAKALGLEFADTDTLITQRQNKTIPEIFDTQGEAFFRDLEHAVCAEISNRDGLVVSTGGGALTFPRNVEALKRNGTILFLDVPFSVLSIRIGDGESRPLFRDKHKAEALYRQRIPLYQAAADVTVDGSGTVQQVVKQICNMPF